MPCHAPDLQHSKYLGKERSGRTGPDRIGFVEIVGRERSERSGRGLAVDLSRSWSSECFVKVVLAKLRLNCRLWETGPRSSATANYSLAVGLTNGAMIQSNLSHSRPIHLKYACNHCFIYNQYSIAPFFLLFFGSV